MHGRDNLPRLVVEEVWAGVTLSEPEVVSELLARWDAFRSARAGEQVAETLRLDPAFVALMRKSGYDFRPGEETTP